MQMGSKYIRAALFSYLRFGRRCPYVASEVGGFNADVCSIYNKKLVEYEIKVSMRDFKVDFKKPKHNWLGPVSQGLVKIEDLKAAGTWLPHEFYFVVTPDLLDQVLAYLVDNPIYGVMLAVPKTTAWDLREAIQVVKKAKRIHDAEIKQIVYSAFLYRMSSELAGFHSKLIAK